MEFLLQYDAHLVYVQGEQNCVADALSRQPTNEDTLTSLEEKINLTQSHLQTTKKLVLSSHQRTTPSLELWPHQVGWKLHLILHWPFQFWQTKNFLHCCIKNTKKTSG
jgi:hypothetical protein